MFSITRSETTHKPTRQSNKENKKKNRYPSMHNTLSSDAKRISIIKLGLFTHRNSYMVIYTETCKEQNLKENRGINYLLSEEPPFWLRNERKRGELTS